MVPWKKTLDPFMSVLPTTTAAVLPLLLSLPGCSPVSHLTVYLPTSGKENDFLEEVSNLQNIVHQISEDHPNNICFIRGDANVNPNHVKRVSLLNHLKCACNLVSVQPHHNTYHHFLGGGSSDSPLDDVILHMKSNKVQESVSSIVCALDNPELQSHHDMIFLKYVSRCRW